MRAVITVLLVLAASMHAVRAQQQCEKSGYCSLGQVATRFRGNVQESATFREVLEKVSYKKEVILTTHLTATDDMYIEEMMQMVIQMNELGFGHILMLSYREEACKQLDIHMPDSNCVWDLSPVREKSFEYATLLWHLRWRFLARAIPLGYNILSLDSDYSIFHDPYLYFKAPPFNETQMFAVTEGFCGVNGGFIYVQNAAPNGPVSWIFKRLTELPLRWMDDDFAHLVNWGKKMKMGDSMCLTFDQSFLDDAIHSAISAHPYIIRNVILVCLDPQWVSSDGRTTQQQLAESQYLLIKSACTTKLHRSYVEPPKDWGYLALPGSHAEAESWPLLVPHYPNCTTEPPANMGGRFFPDTGGKYSSAFLTQLREDCIEEECKVPAGSDPSGSVLVTPPERKHANGEYTNHTFETLMQVPKWLATSAMWMRNGLVTPLDKSPPRVVALHAHVGAPGAARMVLKKAVRKLFGAWNWTASHKLHSHPDFKYNSGYFTWMTPTKVIALDPSILLSRTRKQEEYKRIVIGLIQVATILNRTFVLPDLPCETPWIKKGDAPDAEIETCQGFMPFDLSAHPELLPYRVESGNPALDMDSPGTAQ